MSSYFYQQAEKNAKNADFIDKLQAYADSHKTLVYVLNRPLTDQKYSYRYTDAIIVLSPRHRIAIYDFGSKGNEFSDYVEDIIEDIGSISDKYLYKEIIGRPRMWRSTLVTTGPIPRQTPSQLFKSLQITQEDEIRKIDLLISLFIGSINEIERVKDTAPETLLDKVKQKIQLFDGDQTRFVYQRPDKKKIRIQGLSGTGKTELLLHKLKDLYTADNTSKIFFTCHNRILADNLRKRIPEFFNFMKVEQQIEWGKRLWCAHAWGSGGNPDSGAYRYICSFYNLPFHSFSYNMSFAKACKLAVEEIREKYKNDSVPPAFTYMLIDESQDFDEHFIELCDLVTEKNLYIAGDIFQSIFDEKISSTIEPDFLLGKVYRTDPKTLMFAHALGMGLFEQTKLRWIEEKEWRDCGYNVHVTDSQYHLTREPIRRFEDLDAKFESIKVVETTTKTDEAVIQILTQIRESNPTVSADDIGIIFLDQEKTIYAIADHLEIKIYNNFIWEVNKAYESKEKLANKIFVSNRNNVKGLEFPFVICITRKIRNGLSYRNTLYTMLTRSFIQSYLLMPRDSTSGLTGDMKEGLREIIEHSRMTIAEPSSVEKETIQTRFKYNLRRLSHYDMMMEAFQTLKVHQKYHEKLLTISRQMDLTESDQETINNFVKDNLKYINED